MRLKCDILASNVAFKQAYLCQYSAVYHSGALGLKGMTPPGVVRRGLKATVGRALGVANQPQPLVRMRPSPNAAAAAAGGGGGGAQGARAAKRISEARLLRGSEPAAVQHRREGCGGTQHPMR